MSKEKFRSFVPNKLQISILMTLHKGGYLKQDGGGNFCLFNNINENIPIYNNTSVNDLIIKSMIKLDRKFVEKEDSIKVEITIYNITSKGIVVLALIEEEGNF